MRIALVDPSRTTRLIVARMLEAGGHEVVPFADDRDALIQIKADPQHRGADHQRRAQAYVRRGALLGDAASRDQPPPDLRADDVQSIRSPQPDRGLGLGRRRFHRQAAARRGALCAAPRRRAHCLDAARVDQACDHRPAHRAVQSARLLRAGDRGLCTHRSADGSVSAIILDIDNFKRINDSYGHETGDEAIRACAEAARMQKALTGRLGGDEFALILEQRTLPQAIEVAEDLQIAPCATAVRYRQGPYHADLEHRGRRRPSPAILSIRSSPAPMLRSTTPSSRGATAWSASMRDCRCATPWSPKESCAPARWPRRLSSFLGLPSFPRAALA